MNVLVACKVVFDDRDVKVASDGSLDFSKAAMVISGYDKNAIEAATMIAAGGSVKAITVGGKEIDNAKVKKDILARGVDELFVVAGEDSAGLDAFAAAGELAALAGAAGEYDAIVVGAGSADVYAQQTGVQLAAALDIPYVSGVIEATAADGKISAKRLLETEVEAVEVATPCVLAVTPDFAQPRICGMKDILAAGKKPMNAVDAAGCSATVSEKSVTAPKSVDRKLQVFTDVDEFVAAVKAAL